MLFAAVLMSPATASENPGGRSPYGPPGVRLQPEPISMLLESLPEVIQGPEPDELVDLAGKAHPLDLGRVEACCALARLKAALKKLGRRRREETEASFGAQLVDNP
jgi:hypothetical protein